MVVPGRDGTTLIYGRQLPRPAAELERLAEYYGTHDTSMEMDNGDWVEPQPMATTSLRLPADVIDQLKQQARTRHVRYTTYVRAILERAARGGSPPEWVEITERLDRIERALSAGLPHDDQKTALQTSRQVPQQAAAVPARGDPPGRTNGAGTHCLPQQNGRSFCASHGAGGCGTSATSGGK